MHSTHRPPPSSACIRIKYGQQSRDVSSFMVDCADPSAHVDFAYCCSHSARHLSISIRQRRLTLERERGHENSAFFLEERTRGKADDLRSLAWGKKTRRRKGVL